MRFGPLSSRMNADDVETLFPYHKKFFKTKKSNQPTSVIFDSLAHVYYDKNGYIRGVEALKFLQFTINEREVFWENLELTLNSMKIFRSNFEINSYGADINLLGISTFASDFDGNLNSPIDSIYVKLAKG